MSLPEALSYNRQVGWAQGYSSSNRLSAQAYNDHVAPQGLPQNISVYVHCVFFGILAPALDRKFGIHYIDITQSDGCNSRDICPTMHCGANVVLALLHGS